LHEWHAGLKSGNTFGVVLGTQGELATSNVRDQRRRAIGAPLADRNLSAPVPVLASGVTTRDDRCIA
jgi:hypothetical protein